MDPEKVELILKRETPKDEATLLSFLGITNYYRILKRNYADKAFPFYNLLREDSIWKRIDECEEAFLK
jgi:hypothetical protein